MKTGAASWTERIASPGADPLELPGRAMTLLRERYALDHVIVQLTHLACSGITSDVRVPALDNTPPLSRYMILFVQPVTTEVQSGHVFWQLGR
ncbi:hypothetical protein DQ403_01155 [Stutzerimonas zhaodongensis]|jgi:hypothetical protein|uniref:Uncharacterized protein n=1 Tax=Stutzerimonas zhaodongensis TaxID=1176257 RepID=A0A365PZ54_9GAMM|nr:hypothetical protein DQ403_01155 [Stutzerimonas zhaodongensis]|tara:strand:+ start:1756 stop:2034 length:279 start_codon:yes stop_codon:yes gene_type:complete